MVKYNFQIHNRGTSDATDFYLEGLSSGSDSEIFSLFSLDMLTNGFKSIILFMLILHALWHIAIF